MIETFNIRLQNYKIMRLLTQPSVSIQNGIVQEQNMKLLNRVSLSSLQENKIAKKTSLPVKKRPLLGPKTYSVRPSHI